MRLRGWDERYDGQRYRGSDQPFEEIYRGNHWNDPESASGDGSNMAYTAPLRAALPGLVKRLGVKRFLDAPCGDFNWMRHVDLGGANYIGGDIAPSLVADLKAKYERADREFRLLNIIDDELPEADIWQCRDVLIHLPNEAGLRAIQNFARSPVKYLLVSTYPFARENRDVEMGGFRYVNVRKAPFNLPKPLEMLDDFIVPEAPRYMALYDRETVAKAVLK